METAGVDTHFHVSSMIAVFTRIFKHFEKLLNTGLTTVDNK